MERITDQKILNAIKYFLKNTKNVRLTKLFKLLYFLDFMYFGKHGLSVTCLDYYTYPFGPVPKELYLKISNNELPEFYNKEMQFIKGKGNEEFSNPVYTINLKNRKIDLDCFSFYEKEMLKQVAEIFKEADANVMIEASHFKNLPWDKTKNTKGMFQLIDYELALDKDSSIDIDNLRE
ncbi:MAG: Panacea domain-containing protein, partial [Bacteroidetes bacterium]|nr:Panacea domain-containing protein [Bacteroidota bacterium]